MSAVDCLMIEPDLNTAADFAVALLIHYSFELGGYTASELIDCWLHDYSANWVRLAVIEALYQGRYKAISVEQILAFWQRRGQAVYHFNHEFERLICGNFTQLLAEQANSTKASLLSATVDFSDRHDYQAVVTAAEGSSEKTSNNQPLRSPKGELGRPIEQFTPADDGSDFYTKLKAIAQNRGNDLDEATG